MKVVLFCGGYGMRMHDILARLAPQSEVIGYEHRHSWMPAETFKERSALEGMYKRGDRPWALWESAKGRLA